MLKQLRNLLVGLLSVSLGFAGVVASEAPSFALNASTFDPGLIVADSVFYDWGAMTADEIQNFLNARVSKCTDNDGGPKCIRNYREDVVGTAGIKGALHSYALRICADVPAASDQTAATIIYKVAVACRINPKVLLVTLQKEQGLIQSPDPTTYMYKAAMGYGCPDSAPQVCGKDSVSKSRLFYQLYRAAWQLRWYGDPRGSFTYLKPGKTITMSYNPKSSCKKSPPFKLKSQATANLYYYTPYTPNASALKNLWGTGDSCSAYGNRNFWRQFWTWFGSPVSGGYLLKSPTSATYLVNQSTSKRFAISNAAMVNDFAPLGPVGTVSEEYINSFSDGGELTSLVSDPSGKRYLIASGLRYRLASSEAAASLGYDWASATPLTDVQVSNFADIALVKSTTSGSYLLSGTMKHLVPSSLLPTISKFGKTAVVGEAILAKFQTGVALTPLLKGTSGAWFVTAGNRVKITAAQASALGLDFTKVVSVSEEQLATIPSPILMKDAASQATYLVDDYLNKYPIAAAEAVHYSALGTPVTVAANYLNSFFTKSDPGRFINSDDGSHYYLIGTKKFKVTSAAVAQAISPSSFGAVPGFTSLPSLSVAELDKYALGSADVLTNYVKGSTSNFIIENGKLREVLDPASLAAVLNISPALSPAPVSSFSNLPIGLPIISDSNILKNSTNGSYGIYIAGSYYPLSASLFNEIKSSSSWHISRSSGSLAGSSIAMLPQGNAISHLSVNGGTGYLLGAEGKKPIADIYNVVANPTAVPAAILNKIDNAQAPAVATPFLAKASATSPGGYLISNRTKRPVVDSEEAANMLPLVGVNVVQVWPQGALDQIASATSVIAPASVVRVKESGNLYLIDGWGRGLRVSATTAKALGESTPKTFKRSQLSGYNTASVLDWQKVSCNSKTYLADNGTLLLIDSNAVDQWPGSAVKLDATTCQKLNPSSTRVGLFVAYGSKKYKIESKKLRYIRAAADYLSLSKDQTPAALVSDSFIKSLAFGNPTSYVVVRGDSLSGIAAKFKISKRALRAANKLTTDTITKGQVLRLP